MARPSITRLMLVPMALSAAFAGGCVVAAIGAGAAAGIGTYAYITGKLEANVEASLDKSYAASRAAVKSMGFTETSAAADAVSAKVTAVTADNTDVTIDLKPLTSTSTQLGIRVGVFGDEARSVAILDQIKKKL